MRAVLALLLATATLSSVGCGSEPEAADRPEPAADAPTASAEPSEPPPSLDVDGPPPAWIETGGGSFWLAYSTFCWKTACADYIAPSCADVSVPQLAVRPNEEVRFHLAFDPKSSLVGFFRGGTPTMDESDLEPGREPIWTVDRAGPFVLRVTSVEGFDASYAACIRFPAGSASSGAAPVPGGELTVEEAIAFGSSEPVVVKGTIIAPKKEPPRLCNALLESNPPQCGRPSLVVRGIDLETIPGLVTAEGVSFTNEEVTLLGTVHGTVLAVSATATASSPAG
jgi:hypothetical protein